MCVPRHAWWVFSSLADVWVGSVCTDGALYARARPINIEVGKSFRVFPYHKVQSILPLPRDLPPLVSRCASLISVTTRSLSRARQKKQKQRKRGIATAKERHTRLATDRPEGYPIPASSASSGQASPSPSLSLHFRFDSRRLTTTHGDSR